MSTKEKDELMVTIDDLMAPATGSQITAEEAGYGSEDLDAGDVILPRLSMLQGLSKAVAEELPGAKQGVWWLSPYNRPVTLSRDDIMKMVVVKIFPAQRLWTPIDEGGGLVCEAAAGDLIARDSKGLAGAKLEIKHKSGEATSVEWTGGEPTNDCSQCVYGPAAAATAAGRVATGRGNPWLPKLIEVGGKQIRIPDSMRAPQCTTSLDALVLVQLPAFKDDDTGIELGSELTPAFITFGKTAMSAGRSLAGMVKMAVREPSYAKIYGVGAKQVANAAGQKYFVPTVTMVGSAKRALMDMAQELYLSAKTASYRADFDEPAGGVTATGNSDDAPPPSDDDPEPDDAF